jgi:hypothetical protein
MRCPKCGTETMVLREIQGYRQRQCPNPHCRFEIATREELVSEWAFPPPPLGITVRPWYFPGNNPWSGRR